MTDQPTPDTCPRRHPGTGAPCLHLAGHDGPHDTDTIPTAEALQIAAKLKDRWAGVLNRLDTPEAAVPAPHPTNDRPYLTPELARRLGISPDLADLLNERAEMFLDARVDAATRERDELIADLEAKFYKRVARVRELETAEGRAEADAADNWALRTRVRELETELAARATHPNLPDVGEAIKEHGSQADGYGIYRVDGQCRYVEAEEDPWRNVARWVAVARRIDQEREAELAARPDTTWEWGVQAIGLKEHGIPPRIMESEQAARGLMHRAPDPVELVRRRAAGPWEVVEDTTPTTNDAAHCLARALRDYDAPGVPDDSPDFESYLADAQAVLDRRRDAADAIVNADHASTSEETHP